MRDGMTIVKSFINNAEAQLALSQLEAMGIKGFVEVDNCGGMRPHMDITGGVHLLVGSDELEQATKLLGGLAEKVVSEPWTCASCGENSEAGFDTCWNCGTGQS